MAEFSEVMKQLARMANAYNGQCEKCPLDNAVLCTGPWCFGNTESIAEAERIVMQWAAEHPVVYPTWWEWLVSIGAVTRKVTPDVAFELAKTGLMDQIDPDTANELGIKPKEGA